jgi:CSLREA domain-containing protein
MFSVLFFSPSTIKQVSGATFTVNSTGDAVDANKGDGICAASDGTCTLRAAIEEANALAGADTITFSIAPDNPPIDRIIDVSFALPIIQEQLTIQGPNLGGMGGGANIVLDGDGTFVGLWINVDNCIIRKLIIRNFEQGLYSIDTSGLLIVGNRIGKFGLSFPDPAEGNTKEGVYLSGVSGAVIGGDTAADRNIISGNGEFGINVVNSASVVIKGNYIGTNIDGTAALPNGYSGIRIGGDESTSNTIGGSTAGRRNIISGNSGNGIFIDADNNDVFGNYIGLDASGSSALPNEGDGIYIYSWDESPATTGNNIGGTIPGQGNVISGNTSSGIRLANANTNFIKNNIIGLNAAANAAISNHDGIVISKGSANEIGTYDEGSGNIISGNQYNGIRLVNLDVTGTTIRRNLIGTNLSGNSLPNGGSGISISFASENIIGGGTDFPNIIANNGNNGVDIFMGTQNAITYNQIFNNGAMGIDLINQPYETGVTLNDVNDVDVGSNDLQNYPVLTKVSSSSPGQVTIDGYLNSTANKLFILHFYANSIKDPTGHGEGEIYLGSKGVTTSSEFFIAFTATFTVSTPFECIAATATDPYHNTSEFSSCVPVMNNQIFLPSIVK